MDWNNDGKKDLLSGDTKGQVWLFLNTATDEAPELAAGIRVQADGKPIIAARYAIKGASASNVENLMGVYSKLHFADWDGDGLRDLLVGQSGSNIPDLLFYKNIGTQSEPKLAKPEPLELPGPKMSRPSPYVVDWDGDGKLDMLFGVERLPLYFFRNTGTAQNPKLERGKPLNLAGKGFDKGYRCRIDVTDWNGDNKLDILVGNFYSQPKPMGGNIWLFLGK